MPFPPTSQKLQLLAQGWHAPYWSAVKVIEQSKQKKVLYSQFTQFGSAQAEQTESIRAMPE